MLQQGTTNNITEVRITSAAQCEIYGWTLNGVYPIDEREVIAADRNGLEVYVWSASRGKFVLLGDKEYELTTKSTKSIIDVLNECYDTTPGEEPAYLRSLFLDKISSMTHDEFNHYCLEIMAMNNSVNNIKNTLSGIITDLVTNSEFTTYHQK